MVNICHSQKFEVQVGTAESSKRKEIDISTELIDCDPAQASVAQLAEEQTSLLTQLSMETGLGMCLICSKIFLLFLPEHS